MFSTKIALAGLYIAAGLLLIAAMMWHLSYQQKILVESSASNTAKLLTNMLHQTRVIYAEDVVAKVRNTDITVTHDDLGKMRSIPLPATFSMRLGEKISIDTDGVKSKLYSPYPFPWRENTGGLSDEFSRKAWEALVANPEGIYQEFYTDEYGYTLRYATADIMEASCVACHNSHENTPRRGWKQGDVRGVLEVKIPLDVLSKRATEQLRSTIAIYLGSIILVTFLGIITYRFHLNQAILKVLSQTDPLTDLANRRKYDEKMIEAIETAQRTNTPLALLMIDIDFFKQYNDNYGHDAGDVVITRVANSISFSLPRATDIPCRYGGEEFTVLLPFNSEKGAHSVAERIRLNIEALKIQHDASSVSNFLTVSIGISSLSGDVLNSGDLLKKADTALYIAKNEGRNRSAVSG